MERRTGSTRHTGAKGGGGAARVPRAAAATVVGVVLVLVAAGCESDPPPTPSPTPTVSSASPSPSPSATSASPSPTDNPIPTAAREKTEAGAKAFAFYFFDQLNAAWTEPRVGVISGLSDPECQFCKKTEETAQYLVSKNQRYASEPTQLLSAEPFGGAPEGEQFLQIQLIQLKSDLVDAKGKVVATDPKKQDSYYLTLRWSRDHWSVLESERTS